VLKGEGKLSGTKGSIGFSLEIETTEAIKDNVSFDIIDIDTDKPKVKFAVFKLSRKYTLVGGKDTMAGMVIKYSGSVTIELEISPDTAEIAKKVLEEFGKRLATDAVIDGAFTLAIAAVGVAVIAGVANEFIKANGIADLAASVNQANRSVQAGLLDGASGKDSAALDPIYNQFYKMGADAYHTAAGNAIQQGLSLQDMQDEATAQAKKAVAAWPQRAQAELAIRDQFWHAWADQNHGYTTMLSHARAACSACYGGAQGEQEDENGPHLSYWAQQSDYIKGLKKLGLD